MFQSLRKSFIKNVTEDKTIKFFFSKATSDKDRQKTFTMWNNHKNINIPFQDTFSDVKIEKVFGNHATKQGQPGSYVSYFQKNGLLFSLLFSVFAVFFLFCLRKI